MQTRGIRDEDDACPETPQGVRVDEFGCPLDTGDGVPDYILTNVPIQDQTS